MWQKIIYNRAIRDNVYWTLLWYLYSIKQSPFRSGTLKTLNGVWFTTKNQTRQFTMLWTNGFVLNFHFLGTMSFLTFSAWRIIWPCLRKKSLQPNIYGVGRTHLHCDCPPPLINVRIRAAVDVLSYVVDRTRPGLTKRECQPVRIPMALIKGRVYLLSNMNRSRMWASQLCGVDILKSISRYDNALCKIGFANINVCQRMWRSDE